jgi:hypothetical protein
MMQMPLIVVLMSFVPGAIAAQEFCPKKTFSYNLLELDTIECQFDLLFTAELIHFGLSPSDTISTFHRGDGVYAGEIAPYGWVSAYEPAGAYQIAHVLGPDESARVDDLIRYAPDYFAPMQARIAQAARPILCGLIPEEARDFMRLGGHIHYTISLAPSRITHRTPDTYMTTTIILDHCRSR